MKIIWVVKKQFDISVSSVSRVEIIKALETGNHQILLLAGFRDNKPILNLNGKIRYVKLGKSKFFSSLVFDLLAFFNIAYYLIFKNVDFIIIESTAWLVSLPFVILRKLQLISTRLVLDVRTLPVEVFGITNKLKESLFHVSIRSAKFLFDGITVITPFMKKYFINKYNLGNRKIGIWTSGVCIDTFNPERVSPANIELLREELALKDKFIIMYHGVLTPTRGLKETIEAINLLANKYPDIIFLLIGDGIAATELDNSINYLKLKNRVIIKASVPYKEIPSYIALADVGIVPLPRILWWRVSCPIKLMEYLAMQKPVIVTDIEAHQDILDSDNCGIFIPSHHPEAIAQGIVKAYRKRKHLKQMGRQGRIIVQENYTWKKQAVKLENYLNSIF